MDERLSPIVGIDLGTTNSLIAICEAAGPRLLEGKGGERMVPSVVRYREPAPGDLGGTAPVVEAVGMDARSGSTAAPERTVASAKRLMGRGFLESQSESGPLLRVVEGPRGLAAVKVGGGRVLPQEVGAALLRKLAQNAADSLGVPVRRAVITVPAWFDDAQRAATRDAARLAGLEPIRIINEPTAAALAYGIGGRSKIAETIAVFDLGGGTFDVSILTIEPGSDAGLEGDLFTVMAVAGDTRLGGDDIDDLVRRWFLERVAKIEGSAQESAALLRECERAKIALSSSQTVDMRATLGGSECRATLDATQLELLIEPLLQRTRECCLRAIEDARCAAANHGAKIERAVLVGGSTRIPAVRRLVAEVFGVDPYCALNPEEVVALGASIQAAVLAGSRPDMLLLDVIPLSLGIETVGGAVAKMVMRNSMVPMRATEMFSTSVDGQSKVRIHVLQGERELVCDCRSIAQVELAGIPPMPAGIPQIEVEFFVDANGVLEVTARERRSGARAQVQVVPSFGLTRVEAAQMEMDANAHAREDMEAHQVIDLAVYCRLDLKWTRQALGRVRQTVAPKLLAAVEECLARVTGLLEVVDAKGPKAVKGDELLAAKNALDRAAIPIHEAAVLCSLQDDRNGE